MVYGIFSAPNVCEISCINSDSLTYALWYPYEYREVHKFSSKDMLRNYLRSHHLYAATFLITASDESDFAAQVTRAHELFNDEHWVMENIISMYD